MKRRAKRLMSALALVTGALGTTLLLRRRKRRADETTTPDKQHGRAATGDRWARPGMSVTFRGELMPGRSRAERTFRIERLLPSRRVVLEGVSGEHTESEFEPVQFR